MILFKHALRNAILPVITYVGPMLASLMTGSFVVEKIFSVPGLGRDFVSAITLSLIHISLAATPPCPGACTARAPAHT